MKSILVIFLGVLIGFSVNGKTRHHDTTVVLHSAVGVYIGGNNTYNSYSGPSESMNLYDLNLDIGAFGTFDLDEKWQIEIGLEGFGFGSKYFECGAVWKSHDTTFKNLNTISNAEYVSVPLVIKYRISAKSTVIFGARISGLTSFSGSLINSVIVNNVTYTASTGTIASFSTDLENYSKTDVGIILGFQYNISPRFFAAVQLNINFIPIFSNHALSDYAISAANGYYDPVQLGNTNNSLSLRLGYNILMK
jgi:hypothetical protein